MAAAADHLVEQLALGAVPGGDALTQVAVEPPEVRLDLAEVGQQRARRLGELLVAVPRATVGSRTVNVPARDGGDLLVDLPAPTLQVPPTRARASVSEPNTSWRSSSKTVLSRDSVPTNDRSRSAVHPGHRLLDCRGGVVMRFVGAGRVVLAQPAGLGRRPVVQVGLRRLRVGALAEAFVEREQFVVESC